MVSGTEILRTLGPNPEHTERMAMVHVTPETTSHTMSVEQYLDSAFEADMDFVDGMLEERNLGEWEHGDLQSELVHLFRTMLPAWHCRAAVECRLQVSPTRFRVPDVMVLHPGQAAACIIRQPPLICIEILSPEDRWHRLENKLQDYVRMGVGNVWVIEPGSRDAFVLHGGGRKLAKDGILAVTGTLVSVDLNSVFAVLDAASEDPTN